MTPYPRNFEKVSKPGTWGLWEWSADKTFVSFTCPLCAKLGILDDHTIDDDGSVYPSVECPTEGCSFHEFIQLEGWPIQ